MRPSLLTLLMVTLLCTSVRAQKAGTDYAFLFYTADYTNGWTDLPQTKTALPDLADELTDNYGFKVETYGDLTLTDLKSRLAEINRRNFGSNDQVLFFFTGHGFYQPGSDNGYLIPTDGPHEWNFGEGWLGYDKLREYLSGNAAKHMLVAFDACFSGSFGRRTMGAPSAAPWEKDADCATINRSSLRHRSRLYFSSGNKTERVPAQSEFLRRWLQCLRDLPRKGQYVLSDDDLRHYVNTVSSSSPEDGTFGEHEESGKFVFIHKNACSALVNPQSGADNAHWASVLQDKTSLKANEHIILYKNCPHYEEALKLLSGGATISASTSSTILPEGMVSVPGGTFQMGDTFHDGDNKENPEHTVMVSPFQMGRYPVTFEEYDRFTAATGKKQAKDYYGRGQQPVISVSWLDAVSYCNWRSELEDFTPVYRLADRQKHASWQKANYGLAQAVSEGILVDRKANGYRLPTEAEWEFAASYVDGHWKARFGNGKDIIRATEANFNADTKSKYSESGTYRQKTVAVGSLNSPNNLGIHDLAGNVWEWCFDWHDASYYNKSSGAVDPTGPPSGTYHVLRGGCWEDIPAHCTAAFRGANTAWYHSIGFRLARSPGE